MAFGRRRHDTGVPCSRSRRPNVAHMAATAKVRPFATVRSRESSQSDARLRPTMPQPPPSQSPPASLFVCLSFCPSERLVSAISQLVCDFCQMVLQDFDESSKFYMAAQELAENITKYSTTNRVSLEVEIVETDTGHVLQIRTRNQSSPENLTEVERRLHELKHTNDPIELYDRIIEETAPLEGVSGLGLARIRAEGGLEFDYHIDGDELTVIVHAPVSTTQHSGMKQCN